MTDIATAPAALLSVIIRTREDVMFQSQVKSITSHNDKGTFDILPFHAHFITLIDKMISVEETDGTKRQFEIGTGVMHVEENNVWVYLETQTPP